MEAYVEKDGDDVKALLDALDELLNNAIALRGLFDTRAELEAKVHIRPLAPLLHLHHHHHHLLLLLFPSSPSHLVAFTAS
jgi:hypothetical protein